MAKCPHNPKARMPCIAGRFKVAEVFEEVCCDCGLTHSTQYTVRGQNLYCVAARSDAATERWRAKKRLSAWVALRRVCNHHIRRIRARQKHKD